MKDAEIVDLYWDRNEAAIQQTQQKYGAYLSKIAYNILSNLEDSRECVNDTYLNAWNSMPTHRPSVLSTYLGKIARQISIDLFRKKNSAKRYASEYAVSLDELGDSFSDGSTPEQTFDAKQLDDAINRFLRTLPDDARNTFIGRYYFFDSLKDVAGYLSGMWSRGLDDLTWVIEPYREDDAHLLTSVNDKENYDLSLYPIPRADSVPDELRDIVNDPIFEAEELTLEAVYCRAYKVNDAGDTDGWRMKFSVKYGDVIVSVRTKGVEPEWVYQQLVDLISE